MTHKQRFLQRKDEVAFHAALVHKQEFLSAVEKALLHYEDNMRRSEDMVSAASQAWRSEGARDFIKVFLTLSSTPTPAKADDRSNLNPV